MVDIQRRAVLRSLAKAATASNSRSRSPHMYHHQVVKPATNLMGTSNPASALEALGVEALDASDAAFFSALHSPPPSSAASSSSSAASSVHSPYAFHAGSHALGLGPEHDADQQEHDALFAAYAAETQPQELDAHAWDLYYPAPASAVPTAPAPAPLSVSDVVPSSAAPSATGRGASPRISPSAASSATRPRQGVKRPLPSPMPSPVGSAVSSMLAMRTTADAKPASSTTPARARAPAVRRTKKEDAAALAAAAAAAAEAAASSGSDDASMPPTKKTKVSRERQLKINAASRRCRKKQKLELQFLRTHVVDLQSALKDQVGVLRAAGGQASRVARLATFLEESIRQVEDMSSGGRPGTPKASLYSESELQQLKATATQALAEAKQAAESQSQSQSNTLTVAAAADKPAKENCSVRALDPLTGYASLSADRRQTLLNIASFMRNNISLESQSFSPEVISCLPIEMDGWQLRLAITEKNYTIHNCKFFPCDVQDMYDFCWDTNVASKVSIKQGKNDYCVVTPLDTDVAHVYSKTIGKWSLSVHGVANVSYNSLVCRTFNSETGRAMICQQSVLEDRDFQDESTIPWLFKRWVVFQPREVDGVKGCFVEAYRTASYATGRLIYKEDNTYDSFCEHLIRRYAESNSLLERMMARDPRFQHVSSPHDALALDQEETTSDRMVKDLLLF